jgi:hypothetical protein
MSMGEKQKLYKDIQIRDNKHFLFDDTVLQRKSLDRNRGNKMPGRV